MAKWILRVLIALVAVVIVAVGVVYGLSQQHLSRRVDVPQSTLAADLSSGDARRGAHVAVITECTNCHGVNLGGRLFIDDPALGTFYAPNLTRGAGGAASRYSDADWVRALRYGGAPDGRPLAIMPSRNLAELSDGDFIDLIAYVRSVPGVSNTTPPIRVGPVGRTLLATGKISMPADQIRAEKPTPSTVAPGVTVAYGGYLTRVGQCMDCHGAHLSGGHIAGPPSAPPAQNLTTTGHLGQWTFEQFKTTLRTGRRPDGSTIDSFMPWPEVAQMTDDELNAVYLYLKSLPARPTDTG
jgi:mono/diheme cytochrome c family protein